MFLENSFGLIKRYKFVETCIKEELTANSRLSLLDFGCGSGEYLTIPIAREFLDKIEILAFDPDAESIRYLEKKLPKNCCLTATSDPEALEGKKFDIIILSEVLEHVEDPLVLLQRLKSLLLPDGKLLITIPNGYGYFEFDSLLFNMAMFIGLLPLMRKIKSWVTGREYVRSSSTGDTLAISPHINFFTYRSFHYLLHQAMLVTIVYQGRVWVCGAMTKIIERSPVLIRLNSILGSVLPPFLVSGWMFVIQSGSSKARRPLLKTILCPLDRFKRWLNYRVAYKGK